MHGVDNGIMIAPWMGRTLQLATLHSHRERELTEVVQPPPLLLARQGQVDAHDRQRLLLGAGEACVSTVGVGADVTCVGSHATQPGKVTSNLLVTKQAPIQVISSSFKEACIYGMYPQPRVLSKARQPRSLVRETVSMPGVCVGDIYRGLRRMQWCVHVALSLITGAW